MTPPNPHPDHPAMSEQVRGEGQYQPLAWQIVTDAQGYSRIHETDEDGNPGDLVADVFGDHENLIAAAPKLLTAVLELLVIAGTPITDRQAAVISYARSAAAAARAQVVS